MPPVQGKPLAPIAYEQPSADLVALVDTEPTPIAIPGPHDIAAVAHFPTMVPLVDLAERELKLAGHRFNPATHDQTRAPHFVRVDFLDTASGCSAPIEGLPRAARIRHPAWSPDGSRLAMAVTAGKGVELWTADVATATAVRAGAILLNAILPQKPFEWLPDSRTLVVRAVPPDLPPPPSSAAGPIVQESSGRAAAARTYRDLLRDAHDADLFEHAMQCVVMTVTIDGGAAALCARDATVRAEPSPDGRYVLVETLLRPYSLSVPEGCFARRIDVRAIGGAFVRTIAEVPAADAVAPVFDAVPAGPRAFGWRADAVATLFWIEAADGGDPRRAADVRDSLYALAAPFDAVPAELLALSGRFAGVNWGDDDCALVYESWWKTRRMRTWRIRPAAPAPPEPVAERSMEDRYGDPGWPMLRYDARGRRVLRRAGGDAVYLHGAGASRSGEAPFINRLDLGTRATTPVWRSQGAGFETPIDFIRDGVLLTRAESPLEPPNYFVRDLGVSARSALTRFTNPAPQLAACPRELLRYTRHDGIELHATLSTPPGWDAAHDGPLPVIVWAYAHEFKSSDAAGQVTATPSRFLRPHPLSMLPWLLRGFAVLDAPSLPIVGAGEREPNDTYVEQLVASAHAAVDAVVARGAGDRRRFVIGGHSYGAFSAANLLAHSDLFCAGIALSGAYNRTLTPFGFQAEERTFWQAPQTYIAMSPFALADRITAPLLLVHGMEDENSGTSPAQSEQLFHAIKGHGGTARLVLLPHEGHVYRARESLLHVMWEVEQWLEKYARPSPRSIV